MLRSAHPDFHSCSTRLFLNRVPLSFLLVSTCYLDFNDNYAGWCEIKSQSSFNLHFSGGWLRMPNTFLKNYIYLSSLCKGWHSCPQRRCGGQRATLGVGSLPLLCGSQAPFQVFLRTLFLRTLFLIHYTIY